MRDRSSIFSGGLTPLLLIVALAVPAGAFAQIEEITVMARKRAENLQEIPLAVSVFSADRIAQENIQSLADVAALTPSLQFDTGFWPSDTRVSIRGLFNRAGRPSAAVLIDGIDAMSESLESAGGSALLNQRLLDVEQIEVVRGPQSALYGRGAFSGAVNYITRRPEMESGATASGDIAQYGEYEARGSINVPLVDDKLAMRLTGSKYHTDGYYKNPNTGGELGEGTSNGGGLQLLWAPTEDFDAYLYTTYTDDEFGPAAVVAVKANTITTQSYFDPDANGGAGGQVTRSLDTVTGTLKANSSLINISPDPRSIASNPNNYSDYPGTDDETWRNNLILTWDLANDYELKSSTSYTHANQTVQLDTTQQFGVAVPCSSSPPSRPCSIAPSAFGGLDIAADYQFEFDQYYQEFQLSSPDKGPFSWLAGVNAFIEKATDINDSQTWYRSCQATLFFPAAPCTFADSQVFGKAVRRNTDSYSAFGLVSWDILENLTLTTEARYIYDEVKVSASTSDSFADALSATTDPIYKNFPGFADSVNDTNFVPKVALDWTLNEQVMLYTSVANGIKPPTFSTTDIVDPEGAALGKENLWVYEVGAKSTLFEDTVLLNGDVYYNDYQDQQVLVQFPALDRNNDGTPDGQPRSGSVNAGKTTVWGAELDATWLPNDNWMFMIAYAYTNGEYDDLNLRDEQPGGIPISTGNKVKAGNGDADFSGNSTVGNPSNAASLFGKYRQEFMDGIDWYAQSSVTYTGERYADIANLVTLDSYFWVTAQTGFETGNWYVAAYCENLLDDTTIQYGQEFIDQQDGFQASQLTYPVAYYAYLPQPRTVGLRFSYSWGGE